MVSSLLRVPLCNPCGKTPDKTTLNPCCVAWQKVGAQVGAYSSCLVSSHSLEDIKPSGNPVHTVSEMVSESRPPKTSRELQNAVRCMQLFSCAVLCKTERAVTRCCVSLALPALRRFQAPGKFWCDDTRVVQHGLVQLRPRPAWLHVQAHACHDWPSLCTYHPGSPNTNPAETHVQAVDAAKKRAVAQNVDYETFKNMVSVAHLRPLQAPNNTRTGGL